MKYLELPIEKIVKFDDDDLALPDCPVCNTDNFSVVFTKDGPLTIFCKNDNFQLRRDIFLSLEASYWVYENMSTEFLEKQDNNLRALFRKGLISYVTLVGELKTRNVKNA